MSDKLKPCPFCGGEAEIKDNGYVFWAECQKCGATGSRGVIYERAREHWNRRRGNSKCGELVEATSE